MLYRGALFCAYEKETVVKLVLEHVTFHDLRHTFATLAAEPPVMGNPYVIKTILGHANDDITAHYSHTTDEAMRELIERLTRHILGSASD